MNRLMEDQSVDVQAINRCSFWESPELHTYTVLSKHVASECWIRY